MKIKLLFIASAALLAMTAPNVQAYTCSTSTESTTLTPQSVTIDRNLPVGSLIGSQLLSGTVQAFKCSNEIPMGLYQEFGIKGYGTYATTINGRRVYRTNIPGLGYSLGITDLTPPCANLTAFIDGLSTIDGNVDNRAICSKAGFPMSSLNAQVRLDFYKTAQVMGVGTVRARQVGAFILRTDQRKWIYPESAINIAAFNVISNACTVTNTAISVPMGTVEKRAFGGTGTWPGDANTRSFSIPLNCNAGTKVSIQIDGNAHNAAQGVLNLNGSNGSALGVGIQLVYSNAPLPLAIPLALGTAATDGAYNIPLQARYYQTGSNITPGLANASATFTMLYQ